MTFVSRGPGQRASGPSRRRYILPAIGTLGLGAAALLVYGWKIEPRALRVHHFAINLPGISPDYDGICIAFMSDFHLFGPGKNNIVADDAIDVVLKEKPDLVLLGGDFYDHANWRPDQGAFARLSELDAPVYAVLGNHDMRRGETNAAAITRLIEKSGARMLRNRSVTVYAGKQRDQRISLTGIDDPYSGFADLNKATASSQAAGSEPSILLTHAPTIMDNLPVGRFSLVLAGHTHGGQIRTSPWQIVSPLDLCFYLDRIFHQPMSRQQRGFRWERGSLVFVTNGLGTTRWPLRIGAPPEVVFLTLRSRPDDSNAPCDDADRYVEELE